MLNLASVSQQGICGILKKYNISNIGELSSVPDPIQVTHKEEEFLKLDMNTNYVSPLYFSVGNKFTVCPGTTDFSTLPLEKGGGGAEILATSLLGLFYEGGNYSLDNTV